MCAAAAEAPHAQSARPAWDALPQELANVLEFKSTAYAQRATGFVYTERQRAATYEGEAATRESIREYEYQFVKDDGEPEGFVVRRIKPGSKDAGAGERDPVPFPEPYLWTQLFRANVRSTLRFQVGRWHTTPWKLAIPISWLSSSPVFSHQRIVEWSGTVETEYQSGNLVRVVARPSLQDERLEAQLERFLTAFRFLGFGTVPPPMGQELTVDFEFEREGLSYPTRADLATFRLTHRDTRNIVSRRVVEYSNYKFFTTETTIEVPPLTYQSPPESSDDTEPRRRP